MRAVGSGLGGCGALEDLAGQSALDDEAEDESELCELDTDDDEASCDAIRAFTHTGAADTTPRVATNAANGIRDVMAITFQPCNTAATLGLKI